MNRKMIVLLSGLMLVFLALSYGGWNLRTSTEAANKTVITAVDYRELWKTASNANADMDQTLKQLYDKGVRYIGVKELTLRDMAFRGDLYIQEYGPFIAYSQSFSPGDWEQARQALAGKGLTPDNISPSSLVLVIKKTEVADFISRELGSRYQPEQIIRFQSGGIEYFILDIELTQLDQRKEAVPQLDAMVGFDRNVLDKLHKQGFSLILRPENSKGSNLQYIADYQQLIDRYNIKYILFSNEVPGYSRDLQPIENLINKNHLLVGIVETSEQLKYLAQPGLDPVMAATGYQVNRVYSTTNDDYVQTIDERYYRWMRAVIDRGIRVVYISPFKDIKKSYSTNLDNTIKIIGDFHRDIVTKGFVLNQDLGRLPTAGNPPWRLLMIGLSLLAAGTLYLGLLFKLKPPWIIGLLAAGAIGLIAAIFLLHMDLTKLFALAAAIIYPSLSSLLLLLYLRDSQSGLPVKLLSSLGIIVAVNMIGAYTIICSLSDIQFIMNIKEFTGVKLSFLFPLLLFALNYFSCFSGQQNLFRYIWDVLSAKPSYLVLLLFFLAAGAGYYYIGRSGNNLVSVSGLELKLREILEGNLLARPRFKEIMIGYPALFAAVYLYHKYRQEAWLLILGFGIIIGSISMVNSFCHVFTAATISIIRTAGGLALGSLLGICAIAGIWILEKCIKCWGLKI
jgi:predicted outer membrane lipoprotein